MIRVFPRKTKWTPDDELAFVGEPPLPEFRPADPTMPVFVSCTFTWDAPYARRLAASWKRFYWRVELGGPAFDDPGGEFVSIEKMRCYVLVGYPGDVLPEAMQRLQDVYALGFLPFGIDLLDASR